MKLNTIPWRKIICYAIYILLIPSIQVTLSPVFSLLGQPADIMLVFAVLTGFLYGFTDGVVVGLLMGFVRDLLSGTVILGAGGQVSISFGIGMLVLFLGGVFGALFFEGRTNRNFLLGFMAVVSYTLIYKLFGIGIISLWEGLMTDVSQSMNIKNVIFDSIFTTLLINAVCAIPVFFLLRYVGPVKYTNRNERDKNNKELTYGDSGKWLTI